MARPKHPLKEIEQSLSYAESQGWRIEIGGGHAWAKFTAPTMTMSAAVASSVSQVFGALQEAQVVTPEHCVG